MPFLNSTRDRKEAVKKQGQQIQIQTNIRPAQSGCSQQLILFGSGVPHGAGNTNKKKGEKYERYVGSLYEKYGYQVEYNGIVKGSRDKGIDLICHDNKYTVLVQCKCFASGGISVNIVYLFYGSFRHYAITHPKETVSCSLWTSLKLSHGSEAFKAMNDLGIRFYDDVKLPKDFVC